MILLGSNININILLITQILIFYAFDPIVAHSNVNHYKIMKNIQIVSSSIFYMLLMFNIYLLHITYDSIIIIIILIKSQFFIDNIQEISR